MRMDVRARGPAAASDSEDYLVRASSCGRGLGARRGLPVAFTGDDGKRQREKERGKLRNSVPARRSS